MAGSGQGGAAKVSVRRRRIRPFRGTLNSTAFHVHDAAAFELDEAMVEMRRAVDVFSGRLPGDSDLCFCVARGIAPRPPFVVCRKPGELVVGEGGDWDPEVDDVDGWIVLLQRHLDPEDSILVNENGNPDSPHVELLWVITVGAVRCSEYAGCSS